jgi:hypothetical protein
MTFLVTRGRKLYDTDNKIMLIGTKNNTHCKQENIPGIMCKVSHYAVVVYKKLHIHNNCNTSQTSISNSSLI